MWFRSVLKRNTSDYGSYVGKAKTKLRLQFSNYKSKHWSYMTGKQNVSRKCFHSHNSQGCNKGIQWKLTLIEKCETHKYNLKKGKSFGDINWKCFLYAIIWPVYGNVCASTCTCDLPPKKYLSFCQGLSRFVWHLSVTITMFSRCCYWMLLPLLRVLILKHFHYHQQSPCII